MTTTPAESTTLEESTTPVESTEPLDNFDNLQTRLSYHELGHIFLQRHYKTTISYVYINDSRGAVVSKNNKRLTDFRSIETYLAGLVCEKMIFGNNLLNSNSDMEEVYNFAENIVHDGRSKLGLVYNKNMSENSKIIREKTINELVDYHYKNTEKILDKYKHEMPPLVEYLKKYKRLTGNEVELILSKNFVQFERNRKIEKIKYFLKEFGKLSLTVAVIYPFVHVFVRLFEKALVDDNLSNIFNNIKKFF